ncbi:diguanylate cyclase [Agaricicola taiwanensis]|uniref:Diguanylate cyclase n=1 Tax=Agaricicola taiwanensis TaxID=591372 RepID=A0A8J2YFT9_9RHOB|nr:EAL domain-containing protein [Agaricicola taiwanensis]GGE34700.1 diguanylate cyclase [Agaricicola taiwanensis]
MRNLRAALPVLLVVLILACAGSPASALTAVLVPQDVPAIDLTRVAERYDTATDRVQVSTAPGADGIVRRIEVRSRTPGSDSNWLVLALTNNSDEQIDRLLVAPHYRLVGSGVIWPDLGSERIAAVTASQGFRPEREASRDADIFRVTLDPGSTVTFVLELAGNSLPQLYLWQPDAYKDSVNNLTLYKGIVLGIAGLLALILTIVVVVKGSLMFPAAAALAWAVLLWLSIDFGFWHKILDLRAATDGIYRAGAEALLAATLIVFLVGYLNLNRWHVRFVHIAAAWFIGMLALVGIALFDPEIAAGIARISLAAVAVLGFGVVVWLALHGFDRAVMLIPTWLFMVAWVAAGGLAVSGILANDVVAPALVGGIVLIVLLIGFTVMQHAFAGAGLAAGLGSDLERRALAITGSGDVVWDWDVSADRISISPEFEHTLGMKPGSLQTAAAAWLDILHPFDRDRFRAALDSVVAERRGRLSETFRFRAQDGHYHWMLLRARPVVAIHGEVTRCVGTLLDVTESRTAEERLLHNAVHDNLTGLPNRELFLDRISGALAFARKDGDLRPTVLIIDIDGYKRVNEAVGLTVGDTILLTIIRRLGRHLKQVDTLARISGDQFGILLLSENKPDRITDLADQLVKAIRTPISFGGRDIVLTASIGLALTEPKTTINRDDLVRNAEVAMMHAKRLGGDHIEIFKPTMRTARTDHLLVEGELRRALERDEIQLVYQPVVRLEDRTIAGFEALLRWNHSRYGRRPPAEFISIAEETGLIVDFGQFALERAARQLSLWQRRLPVDPPLFMTVNVSAKQFVRQDLVQDVKSVISRALVAHNSLKLEITESVVMENPEHAERILEKLRDLGVGLALDDFGTGHSSLAYLQRFPFDTLKIDKSFVRPQARGQRSALLRSIIQMGKDLELDIVAEGAETDSDAVELFHLGCPYAQGYAFGEPMNVEQAERLLGIATETSAVSSASKIVFGALRA